MTTTTAALAAGTWTGDPVRSADSLDVEHHPAIGFTSTAVRDLDGPAFTLLGELVAEFHDVAVDPSGGERTGSSAVTTVSRAEFGVDIRLLFGAGEVVVADAVEITIDIEFVA